MAVKMLDEYTEISAFEFDESLTAEFERLRTLRVRIGARDLKIASIGLANDATLLSRNPKDFGKVAGLKVEDCAV